jgi:hypothetical protein
MQVERNIRELVRNKHQEVEGILPPLSREDPQELPCVFSKYTLGTSRSTQAAPASGAKNSLRP